MGHKAKIRLAVIGATGSVGNSVLDICARFPERFEVVSLAAGSNAAKLTELGCRFNSRKLCLAEPKEAFCVKDFECLSGVEALSQIAADPDIDQVVFASSGTSAIKALYIDKLELARID